MYIFTWTCGTLMCTTHRQTRSWLKRARRDQHSISFFSDEEKTMMAVHAITKDHPLVTVDVDGGMSIDQGGVPRLGLGVSSFSLIYFLMTVALLNLGPAQYL